MKDNPYVGIQSYERADRHNFYGRDWEARELRALIVAEREVLFYAQSGAGKTSLLNAKVIPALEEKGFHVLPVVRVRSKLLPEIEPQAVDNIFVFSVLLSLAGKNANLQTLLPHTLRSFLEEYCVEVEVEAESASLKSNAPLVLIFDQFEEIFTAHLDRWREVRGFFLQVREALDALPRLGVVFAMREDHVAGIDPYVSLFPRRLRARFRMERLGKKEALAAVAKPASNAGCPFDPGVAEGLVDDLRRVKGETRLLGETGFWGQFVEPVLLQVVCHRLWENLSEQKDHSIQQYGNIDRALTEFYESALDAAMRETDVSERRLRRWFDQHLITPTGTRGLAMREPEETASLPNAAVDVMEEQHLIRADVRAGTRWYELAHDRLIEPVRTSNAAWRKDHLNKLQLGSDLWDEKRRLSGLLLRGQELLKAEAWVETHDGELTDIERDFLKESQKARDIAARERRQTRLIRWSAIGVMIFAIIAVTLAIIAVYQTRAVSRGRHHALSLALAGHVQEVQDHELAVLLGLEAVLQTHQDKPDSMTTPAVNAVHRAMARSRWRATFRGHGGNVGHAAWSPDGTRIVTASRDGSAKVWDVETGEEFFTLSGHNGGVNHAAWSPDGTRIVTASSDGTAKVWDAETGAEFFTFNGHADIVNHAAWSPDGTRIVTASNDENAIVWDAATGEELFILSGHIDWVNHAAWSPDGTRIVTASDDKKARVWDAETGKELFTLSGHNGGVSHAAWSPDGTRIVTASRDTRARVWDAATGEELFILSGHTKWVNHAAWSPDGTRIVTASRDKSARVWDATTGRGLFPLIGHTDGVNHAAWSPDGTRIVTASSDGTARVWDAATNTETFILSRHTDRVVNYAAWSPDGTRIVTASSDKNEEGVDTVISPDGTRDGIAKMWDAATGEEPFIFSGHTNWVLYAAWSSDGTRLVTASSDGTAKVWDTATSAELFTLDVYTSQVGYAAWNSDDTRIVTTSDDGDAKVWDATTGTELFTLSGHTGVVRRAAWSSDDARIVTASDDGSAKVWDATTGEEIFTLSGHTSVVRYAAWSSDDARIVTASGDMSAKIWDAATGEEIFTLGEHINWVRHAAWSPDGALIVTASGGGNAKVWDAATGTEVFTLTGHTAEVRRAAWNPDGTRIVTASWDDTAKVWNVATGKEVFTLEGHTDRVYHAAWSPDGTRIVTTGWDGTAKVWDAATGEEIFTLKGHTGRIYHAAWSPDGTRIVTAGEDGSTRIYFVKVDDLGGMIDFACTRTGRNLTQAEWEHYVGRDEPYRKTCIGLPAGE